MNVFFHVLLFCTVEQDPDDVPIAEVIPILEAAIKSPSYRNTVSSFVIMSNSYIYAALQDVKFIYNSIFLSGRKNSYQPRYVRATNCCHSRAIK